MDTKEFDEYEYKNTNQRIRIKYVRNSSERLNPWEITNFVSRVSTYMYKIEMINTIALAISRGVKEKNIFILDKAYKLNGNYRNFSSIDLNTSAINSVYAIGKPVSMAPNQDLAEMSYLFEFYYNMSAILHQFTGRRITGKDRMDAYSVMRKEGFRQALGIILEKLKKRVHGEEKLRADKRMDDEYDKILQKYQGYLLDSKRFNEIQLRLDENPMAGFLENEREIERKYYKKFYEYLLILQRPVVGIYYEEENRFAILCGDHFDNSLDKHTKVDLKSVTQNSPIETIIEAGSGVLGLLIGEKRKKEIHELEKRKLELEISILEKENDIKEKDKFIKELDVLNKTIELKNKVNSMAETEENLGIKNMASSYANSQLSLAYAKVQNGYSEVLKTNKFIGATDSIIDMKV